MEADKILKKLAKEIKSIGHTLYIVGGYVRDSLLNVPSSDIDITSSLDIDTLIALCNKLELKATPINKKLGTMQIKYADKIYEYTMFRKESYADGKHSPDSVEFVSDIKTDALRRDITINAIYYDILENKIVDPTEGIKDLNKCIIRTPNNPNITLGDDGLRILRLIRFASTYNFSIEKKTLKSLIANTPKLKNISAERKLNEIKLCVVADLKLSKPNISFISLINKTKCLPYVFNHSLNNISKISKVDCNNFYTLNNDARLIGFYILVLKTFFKGFVKDDHLAYYTNSLLGLDGLKESNENIRLTEKLYRVYQNLNYGLDVVNATINYLCLSDTERIIVTTYLSKKANQALSDNIAYIKSKKIPLGVHELKISPEDLINAGIENKYISKILSVLYNQVMECKLKNDLPDLLAFAKDIDKTFKEKATLEK